MSPSSVAVIGVLVLITLFFLRMPVAYAMTMVGVAGFAYLSTPKSALSLLAKDFWTTFSAYSFTVVPMFVFMGTVAFYAGMGGRMYDTFYRFMGHLRGGLALATIAGCAGFGAVCGSTNAAAAAMGKVTLPEMRRYDYDLSLATASVAAAGSLAILIPPSTVLIIYGIMVQESIGKLFAAGILPGLLLAALYGLTVVILCHFKPALAPAGARSTWRQRLASLAGLIEMLLLFSLVLGGLFLGWFTPTEAGAVGAAGALLLALVRKQLSWQALWASLADTTRITAMVFLIVTGASIFGKFMAMTRVPFTLADWVGQLAVPPAVVMAFIIVGYLIAGCFMDSMAMITLTIPILYPVITQLGFDAIWFGVIIVLVAEMGVITPPVGINVYVIKGVAPDVPLETIFRGVFPFVGAILVCIAILIAFPQIALFLPNMMVR